MSSKIEVTYVDEDMFDDVIWEAVQNVAKDMLKEMKASPIVPNVTKAYRESLAIKTDKANRVVTIYERPKNKSKNRVIGHLLENGTITMPAQPHWKYFEDKYTPIVQDAVIDAINKTLK